MVPIASAAEGTAYASTQSVLVDDNTVTFQAYALKDANGYLTNYVKLRDVAQVLNGTAVQFQIGWKGAVNIETGKSYTSNGSEMKTPFTGDRPYSTATASTNIDGVPADLEAIVLTDDQGGGHTYYRLRDLGTALGFLVGWSAEKGIFIETGSGQVPSENTEENTKQESCIVGKQYESANGYGVTIVQADVKSVKGVKTLVFKYTLENLTDDQFLSEKTFIFGFTDGTCSNQGGIYLDGMYPGEKLTKTFNLILEDKELSLIMFDDAAEESPFGVLSILSGKIPQEYFKTHLVWHFE